MDNRKNIKLSLNINEYDNKMIELILEELNKKSFDYIRKTNLIRDLIYKEFLEVKKIELNKLNININNKEEVIENIKNL